LGGGGILANPKNADLPFQIIDAKTQKPIRLLTWKGGNAHFTADSSRLLLAEWSGRCRWFKLPSGEDDGSWDLGLPPEGRTHWVGSISADGSVLGYNGPAALKISGQAPAVLDGKTGQVKHSFAKDHFYTFAAVVSEDGRRAVVMRNLEGKGTSSYDVIDIATGANVGWCRIPSGQSLPTASLSTDGTSLTIFNPETETLHAFDVPKS